MSLAIPRPIGLLAELTHRCPLRCPYCSNPLALDDPANELDTATWTRVFAQAAALGVLQLHLSGGEPAARHDLEQLTGAASRAGLYTNLITSGLGLTTSRIAALRDAGLEHVQLSLQDADALPADRIAGRDGLHARKLRVARDIVAAGLPLTINVVLHRANIARLQDCVALAVRLGAGRIELAHAQYHGWALPNRDALMPDAAQVRVALDALREARDRFGDRIAIDAIVPDYHARRPKPCLGGWARRSLNITPTGRALPCHAAESIAGLEFWSVRDHTLAEIWQSSPAFTAFRGTAWMRQPCASCPRRDIDFGGCRCQALAITGDAAAADPVCALSPDHARMRAALDRATAAGTVAYRYRARAGNNAELTAPAVGLPAAPPQTLGCDTRGDRHGR